MCDAAEGAGDSRTKSAVYLLFILSGFAALACEVSSSRQVGLVVGNTAWAASLVLAAVFAGMAAGQMLGGRLAGRVRPLAGYGVAELTAAGWAALVPTLLGAIDSAGLTDAATAALAFAALLPVAAAFGATLPFVAEHLAIRQAAGRRVALAYGLNTAGGLAGVATATAFLVVTVGVRGSGYLAAGVSALCGLAAYALATRAERPIRPPASDDAVRPAGPPVAWWLVAAVSGFVTIALEVLYARLFALVLHNSTYTFGAVVAVFLAGLALGAALVAALGRLVSPRLLAAAGCGLGAVAVAGSLVVFVRLTGFDYVAPADTFGGYLADVFGLVAAVVLPPAVLLGAAFPAALAVAAGGGRVGSLTAANTLAGAAGALAAGFLLAPAAGLWGAFGVCVALAGLVGVGFLLAESRTRTASGAGLAVALAGVIAVVGPAPLSQSAGRGEEVVQRWESEYGWIDVTRSRSDGSLRVRQNLHYRHGSTSSAAREYRQGRLPLLLHPDPAEVAFLGLGTGITAAPVVADRAVKSAVVVELIPEVVDAARLLAGANRGVVDDPKVRVEVGDARRFLRRTDRRFDVVVADLFVPWESRAGYLYTAEFYADVRRRLKPGGLFCQWLALYQFGPDEFELVADTFAAGFPVATLWWGQLDGRYPMLALVGTEGPIDLDPRRLAARWDASGGCRRAGRTRTCRGRAICSGSMPGIGLPDRAGL